jgi:hypothetical protein
VHLGDGHAARGAQRQQRQRLGKAPGPRDKTPRLSGHGVVGRRAGGGGAGRVGPLKTGHATEGRGRQIAAELRHQGRVRVRAGGRARHLQPGGHIRPRIRHRPRSRTQSPLRGTAVLASRSAAGDLAGSSSRWDHAGKLRNDPLPADDPGRPCWSSRRGRRRSAPVAARRGVPGGVPARTGRRAPSAACRRAAQQPLRAVGCLARRPRRASRHIDDRGAPAWSADRRLTVFWFPFNTPAARVDAMVHAPASFRSRGIFVAPGELSVA